MISILVSRTFRKQNMTLQEKRVSYIFLKKNKKYECAFYAFKNDFPSIKIC